MQNERTKAPQSSEAKPLYKSKRARNVVYLIYCLLVTAVLFCYDKIDLIRAKNFPLFQEIGRIFDNLKIARYDFYSGAWVLFAIIFTVAVLIFIGNIIAPSFIKNKTEQNAGLFKCKHNTRLFYSAVFYSIFVLIAAVIVLIAYFSGFFNLYGNKQIMYVLKELAMLIQFFAIFCLFFAAIYLIIRSIVVMIIGFVKSGAARKEAAEEPAEEPAPAPAPVQETAAEPAPAPAPEPVPVAATVEEPVEEEPVEEEPEEEVADADMTKRKSIQKSFSGKMSQATKEQKEYYNELKNYMLSFKRVSSRVSWNFDSFNIGREKAVKIAFRGQTMVAFFALNPKDYEDTKYFPHDMGDKKKFEDTPMMVKVKSERGVKFAKELIDVVFAELQPKKNFEPEVYKFPYMSDRKLVENGLAKQVYISTPKFDTEK